MIIKLYEEFEDFERKIREHNINEVFFSVAPKSFAEGEVQKTFFVIQFGFQAGEKTLIYYNDKSEVRILKKQEEYTQHLDEVNNVVNEIIKKIQKNTHGVFIRKGTIGRG